jgi:FMN-dependent NADH-azoreductase
VTSLLHIDSSARRASFSRKVAAAFVAEWRAVHPAGGYAYRDLGAHPVPPVDEARTQIAVQASAAGIQELAHMTQAVRTPAQERSWAVARPLIEELLAADAVLIASPMYNLSIPSTLKAWIDQISFPWLSFKDRTVVVVTGRGGSYAPGTPRAHLDFQEPYLRAYFETLGAEWIEFIHAELSNAPIVPFLAQFTDAHIESVDKALATARTLAHTLPGFAAAEATR